MKHGISVQVGWWRFLVSGFEVEQSYGNYRNTMFGATYPNLDAPVNSATLQGANARLKVA
ncbi:MAG: hypothetical protein EA359_05170 [Balneolaceae bacterium]|nr:MAG: hypothetical protein EA359_05170 [Balneolaceae bacterium]